MTTVKVRWVWALAPVRSDEELAVDPPMPPMPTMAPSVFMKPPASTPPLELAAWPDVYNTSVPAGDRVTCGVFPDATGSVRTACFDPVDHVWVDLTALTFAGSPAPTISAPPSLTFEYLRDEQGVPLDASAGLGTFRLTFLRTQQNIPRIFRSAPTHVATAHPMTGQWTFDDAGRHQFSDQWDRFAGGAALSEYD